MEGNAVNVLMVGSGEYTTGFVNGAQSNSDKGAGVVALTMFDLRRRQKVKKITLCGVSGSKFPGIRSHLQRAIGDVYSGLDLSMDTFPADNVTDAEAYLTALLQFQPGDVATIFTPDDTHFDIAMACVRRGLHVLVTKPIVMTLEHHRLLHEEARRMGVLVAVEVHKRFDPIYADARDRIMSQLGGFSYMYSYMSQPKHQLDTFKAWAGKSSDISYYLNSHHIDFHEWCVGHTSRPVRVTALASTGVATGQFDMECEDTITLSVQWENLDQASREEESEGGGGGGGGGQRRGNTLGTAVYTSSWAAPRSDVHSQQRFFYMGQRGEVSVDQAHRGYSLADDGAGFRSVNPLFMKYTPTGGKFAGQQGYGYRSFELFVDAALAVNRGEAAAADFEDERLATVGSTYRTTAVLEAGRRSLDAGGAAVRLLYEDLEDCCRPTGFA